VRLKRVDVVKAFIQLGGWSLRWDMHSTDKGLSDKVLCLVKILHACFLNTHLTLPSSVDLSQNVALQCETHILFVFCNSGSYPATNKLILRRKGLK